MERIVPTMLITGVVALLFGAYFDVDPKWGMAIVVVMASVLVFMVWTT